MVNQNTEKKSLLFLSRAWKIPIEINNGIQIYQDCDLFLYRKLLKDINTVRNIACFMLNSLPYSLFCQIIALLHN